jgi:hypothetical protein
LRHTHVSCVRGVCVPDEAAEASGELLDIKQRQGRDA